MPNRPLRVVPALALALALSCGAVLSLSASTPVFWTVASQASLLQGDIENLSIDPHGRLTLGPSLELVHESTAPFLWALATGADGALYVGSGNEGKVFRVDASGADSVFFDANELEVHALAVGPDGALYVGTSPEGRVYKVARDGTTTTFFDPDDTYIWALAFDAAGNLFVATGERGVVYRVEPDGQDTVFYGTQTTHAVSLAVERDGSVLVGTEAPGKLFRVDAGGRGFVLLDPGFQEIHAIRSGPGGAIYVTAVSDRGGAPPRPVEPPSTDAPRPPAAAPVATVTTEITGVVVAEAPSAAQTTTARASGGAGRGAVYRIEPDGVWDLLWESQEALPYDVSFTADGSVLVATGPDGKIYQLEGEPPAPTLLARAAAQQVTTFLRDAAGVNYYATANPGKVFRLSGARADRGAYTSEIRDAGAVATWGVLSWRTTTSDGGRIGLYTRSGNTSTPDATWSDWEGPYRNAEGDAIRNPKARYLQWKAEFSGSRGNPVLTSVTAAYLPKNARPQIASIAVHPPGIVFQKAFPTGDPDIAGLSEEPPDRRQLGDGGAQAAGGGAAGLGRRGYEKGLQTFVWRGQDDDGDELRYGLSYRREGETSWRLLKDGLADTIYVWDTTSVPDGTYLVRVVASDSASNPPDAALTGELESALFDIDNGPPQIRVTGLLAGPPPVLQFEVRDTQSTLRRVEYSLDATDWKPVYPKDGMADARVEEYELRIEDGATASNVIIRAVDAANNVATSRGTPPGGPR